MTEEEGFIFRLHPYMANKMHMDNANHLYNVAKTLEGTWQSVTLPHDWSIEQEYQPPEQWEDGSQAIEAGYLGMGIGYYRKRFSLPAAAKDKRIIIEFEGVMRDSTVWVNGCYAGSHISGYTGFAFDITELVFYDGEGENVILVKTDTTLREGWWAEGAGIYRPVYLNVLDSLHIARHGVFVNCKFVSTDSASIQVETKLENLGDEDGVVNIVQKIYAPDGQMVAKTTMDVNVPMLETGKYRADLVIEKPLLWDLTMPNLYTLQTVISNYGQIVDTVDTRFGIREVRYIEDGLILNGKAVEIKGVCVHQDFAGVGNALNPDIIRYRLGRIKAMGGNCYRSAHHPASSELLDICDEMGILVMNENRRFEQSRESIEDLEELILGSRNHPCVFMWSLENEELMPTLPNGKRLLNMLVKRVHKLDPTRQCTVAGHFACRDEEYIRIPDVAGFNYDMGDAAAMRKSVPGLLTIASEDSSYVSTRGNYIDDPEKGYCDSYDSGSYLMKLMMKKMGLKELPIGTIGGASSPNNLVYSWNNYREKAPFLGGMFIWSAFDYRGETFPWNWPAVTSQYGAMDFCGFEKDSFYYWKSLWDDTPLVHLLPHWNWQPRQMVQVDVYSNCEEVEVFLNDISQGRKKHQKGMISTWQIEYKPGEIKAIAYCGAEKAAECRRVTAEKPEKVGIKPVYEGEGQILYKAEIQDKAGIICPTANLPLRFSVENGTIVGVGNGNPSRHTSDKCGNCKTFHGLALVIVERVGMQMPVLTANIESEEE
ncbi:hypothetical protein C808_02588 [Lachnospiraceae bacterium M18-1]|nr:hypothetical protein C808_02588 [Lachnospiraceae bacterium M18-1]